MFGISLVEFLFVLVLAVLIIGPKDFPEIARYLIKIFARIKHFIVQAKNEMGAISKELGIDKIRNEVEVEIASEINNQKEQIEDEITTIIDMYGNEHQVPNIQELRNDKGKDEIEKEVKELNEKNQNNAKK
ncbi:MAG: Sec-independent protein translocase protein TatA [Lentimonas sp.]|jgi:Sec-independent protein translocase protein TatA